MSDSIIDTTATAKPFDYSTLDKNARVLVEMARDNIRTRVGRAMADISEIGKHLLVVKSNLKHGEFGGWLAAEFGWSDRTARKMMSVADRFKSELSSDLTIATSALYMLAEPSVEPEAREEVVARAKAGEKITPAIAAEVATKHATAKSKPPPVKVKAKRKEAESRTDAPPFDEAITYRLGDPSALQEAIDRKANGETITYEIAREIAIKWKVFRENTESVQTPKPAIAFTDEDNPFVEPPVARAAAGPKPGVASEREFVAHERLAESTSPPVKAVADAQPWDDYNAKLTDASKQAESLARTIAEVAGFNAKGQSSIPYADGLLHFEGSVGLIRQVKRNLLESRIAGKSGNRFIPEHEAALTRHVANARKVSA